MELIIIPTRRINDTHNIIVMIPRRDTYVRPMTAEYIIQKLVFSFIIIFFFFEHPIYGFTTVGFLTVF